MAARVTSRKSADWRAAAKRRILRQIAADGRRELAAIADYALDVIDKATQRVPDGLKAGIRKAWLERFLSRGLKEIGRWIDAQTVAAASLAFREHPPRRPVTIETKSFRLRTNREDDK